MVSGCRIAELKNHVGETVRLEGWLARMRQGGGVAFLQVRDGSGLCQCVLESPVHARNRKTSGKKTYCTGIIRDGLSIYYDPGQIDTSKL